MTFGIPGYVGYVGFCALLIPVPGVDCNPVNGRDGIWHVVILAGIGIFHDVFVYIMAALKALVRPTAPMV